MFTKHVCFIFIGNNLELSSCRRGEGVERVFKIVFIAFQKEELCVGRF